LGVNTDGGRSDQYIFGGVYYIGSILNFWHRVLRVKYKNYSCQTLGAEYTINVVWLMYYLHYNKSRPFLLILLTCS